ncbi:hypothetical protein ES332_D07G249500v1 [Gossypium tomentosum]|uniref:Starch synthase catalytic domain-containing protein n=1 Tax=Gossypium tomentosum TaxID=34277 RepID=A0A5D2KAN8_GOSTO|nr:hypothetical protein ES332_D07G249500v1 [Gossypium tomentosum]
MASIGGSSTFIIERKSRHVFTSSTLSPTKIENLAVFSGSTSGVSLFCNRGQLWRLKPVRIAGDDPEGSLQFTIKKSKKIAERRKLVSSIKSNITDLDEDEAFHEQRDKSLPDVELTSSSSISTVEDKNGSILSSSHVTSTVKDVSEIRPSDEVDDEPEVHLSSEKASSDLGSTELLKTTDLKAFKSDVLPSFPSSSSDAVLLTSIENENSTKASLEMVGELHDPAVESTKPPPLAGANVMNIILVAIECAPWSKTGGLGDVAGSLPKALARRGHRVMVVAPRYAEYVEPQDIGVRKKYKVDGQDMEVSYFHVYIDGVDFIFMDTPTFRHMQYNIYAGKRQVPWYVPCGGVCYGDGNLVFIANDWHTALLPVYLKANYRDNGLMSFTRSILVVHNIAHQILFSGAGAHGGFLFCRSPRSLQGPFQVI